MIMMATRYHFRDQWVLASPLNPAYQESSIISKMSGYSSKNSVGQRLQLDARRPDGESQARLGTISALPTMAYGVGQGLKAGQDDATERINMVVTLNWESATSNIPGLSALLAT